MIVDEISANGTTPDNTEPISLPSLNVVPGERYRVIINSFANNQEPKQYVLNASIRKLFAVFQQLAVKTN